MIAVEQREYPFAFIDLAFLRGARLDPPGLEGLAYLTGQLMLRGAGSRDYESFQDALDVIGSSLDISVGRDHVTVSGDALSTCQADFFGLLRDALAEPRFDVSELDRLVRQTVAELEEIRDSDEELAQHIFNQILLAPDHGARPLKGTPQSLARVTVADLRMMHDLLFRRAGLVAGGAGDIDITTLTAALGPEALRLPLGPVEPPALWRRSAPPGIHVWLVDKPERTQTQIFAGHPAPPLTHPDHDTLVVANAMFGGTFTARLSHEIREKRGWSYGAYSSYSCTPYSGSFFFRYYPAAKDAVAALTLGIELLDTFVREGPTNEEVAFAKAYMANQAVFRFETPHKRLGEAMQCRLFGLPPDALDRHLAAVAAASRDQIHTAASRWLRPRDLVVTIVCTASDLIDGIRAIPGVQSVQVMPYSEDTIPNLPV